MDTQKYKPYVNDDYDFTNDPDVYTALKALETRFAMQGVSEITDEHVMGFLSGYALKYKEEFLGSDFKPEMLVSETEPLQ